MIIYILRREGGRGLLSVTKQYKKTIINVAHYLVNSQERLLKTVVKWTSTRGNKSLINKAEKYAEETELNFNTLRSICKEKVKTDVKEGMIKKDKTQYEKMQLHGQYARELNQPYIDKEASLAWLKTSRLKGPTEATIFAIQEQAITTKHIEKYVHKSNNDNMCRLCLKYSETIHHVVSGCPVLAPTKYTERHDNVGKLLFIKLANHFELIHKNEQWYSYNPPPVLENENAKLLWNFNIQTDHTIKHNKPDLIVYDKKGKKIFIIDIAIPNDYNVVKKRAEKLHNYTDLAVELKAVWNVSSVSIIPFIIGATGLINNRFIKDTMILPIKIKIDEFQKIALLGTANISRAFFSNK